MKKVSEGIFLNTWMNFAAHQGSHVLFRGFIAVESDERQFTCGFTTTFSLCPFNDVQPESKNVIKNVSVHQ
jgi:hypothetical protein